MSAHGARVRTIGIGAMDVEKSWGHPDGCTFRVYLVTCNPAGRVRAGQAPGCAVAGPTSSG